MLPFDYMKSFYVNFVFDFFLPYFLVWWQLVRTLQYYNVIPLIWVLVFLFQLFLSLILFLSPSGKKNYFYLFSLFLYYFLFFFAVNEDSTSSKQKNGGTRTKIRCLVNTVHQPQKIQKLDHLLPLHMLKRIVRLYLLPKLTSLVYLDIP